MKRIRASSNILKLNLFLFINLLVHDPKWSLERRESSGHLVWRKDSPESKVRFRFDVEVLEFEKHPHEELEDKEDHFSITSLSATVAMCATCVAVVAASVFLPWYLMEKVGSLWKNEAQKHGLLVYRYLDGIK